MSASVDRLSRERRTLELMIGLHCRERHGRAALCATCEELRIYARRRLDRCVFGGEKPTCAVCPIHCYSSVMRAQVREVMRWAGPRMLRRHPVLAIRHLLDERRPLSPKAEAIRTRRGAVSSARAASESPGA